MKLTLAAVCAFALVWSAGAAGSAQALPTPDGLHAFVERADAPVESDHTYAQMPAFAWQPVRGATAYEIQIATNRTFNDGSTFVDRKGLQAPVVSVDRQVPWMTGHPFAFWARVRAVSGSKVSTWSRPFGFNTEWQQLPRELPAPPGLIRWTPVDGATAYDVWFLNAPGGAAPRGTVHVRTLTNVADEREYWPLGPETVEWRVRAVRYVDPTGLPNQIHAESHGPYTGGTPTQPYFQTSRTGEERIAAVSYASAASSGESTKAKPAALSLMPGFTWKNDNQLSRVYVYSDRGCVNDVTIGTAVAGPAWAPRVLPATEGTAEDAGPETMADGVVLTMTSEQAFASQVAAADAAGSDSGAGAAPEAAAEPDPGHIELPDNGWPAGRYWWTVVPVSKDPTTGALQDAQLPQDACGQETNHVWQFGMRSTPAVTENQAPFASGLAGTRVVSSAHPEPSFDQLPLVTWKPALGAQGYQVQLSHERYPWKTVRAVESSVPSVTLPLSKKDKGTWYYRVRGLNGNLPGTANKLTWSPPVAIRITGDRFVIRR